jgi:hypothetical protein
VAVVTEVAGSEDAVKLIAGVLEREARAQRLTLDAPIFAAQLYLSMVISWPQRRAVVLGRPMPPTEVDAWARDVVNLFLNGCRGWMPAKRCEYDPRMRSVVSTTHGIPRRMRRRGQPGAVGGSGGRHLPRRYFLLPLAASCIFSPAFSTC